MMKCVRVAASWLATVPTLASVLQPLATPNEDRGTCSAELTNCSQKARALLISLVLLTKHLLSERWRATHC